MVDGPGFFDRPFPSDTRTFQGHPDFSGFPGQGEVALLDDYIAVADEVKGFGTNSPLFVRFEEAIDTAQLPTPQQSRAVKKSTVLLVDVDPRSPYQGEPMPLTFQWTADATSFQPSNLLAITPVPGFPLRPATTYALVLKEPLARKGSQTLDWEADKALNSVEATLRSLDVDLEEVAMVTTFTTQDPRAELAAVAREIHDNLGMPFWDQEVTQVEGLLLPCYVYQGYVDVPIWQRGQRPYRNDGGGFVFDTTGKPEVQAWERVRFTLTVPFGDMPAAGWPVVIYGHGTGGDDQTIARRKEDEGPVLAREGMAVLAISQPLHGDRATPDTDAELDSFNYLNPEAGRGNFRQGAADHIFIAELLTSRPPRFSSSRGEILLDPARVAYFGHSQGGLSGGMAAPFLAEDVRAVGFSGAGGVLALTLELRKDPLDIQALIESLLGFGETEEANLFHPVVGLIQSMAEVTDPINYAPGWYVEDPRVGGQPLPVLLTEGLLDEYTPSVTTEALAAAARVPVVGPPANAPEAFRLRGLDPEGWPASNNVRDWTGAENTAGLAQYPENGHFAIYDNPSAEKFYATFLATALRGQPVLEP